MSFRIGTKLREEREKRRLSQTELADMLDVPQTTYQSWESDKSCPKAEHFFKLSNLLEIPINDLAPEGTIIKIVQNHDNKDNSVNGFEISLDPSKLYNDLAGKYIKLLEDENKDLKLQQYSNNEANTALKAQNEALLAEVERLRGGN